MSRNIGRPNRNRGERGGIRRRRILADALLIDRTQRGEFRESKIVRNRQSYVRSCGFAKLLGDTENHSILLNEMVFKVMMKKMNMMVLLSDKQQKRQSPR